MNKHNSEYLESIAPDIKRAAEKVARQFPSIEYDDIYQNLWVWVLEESYELQPSAEGGAAIGFLEQAGRRMCGKELAERNPRADAFYYSPKIVRKMLDAGLLYYEGEDVAGRSDLLVAYQSLSEEDQANVRRAFLDGNCEHRKPGAAAMAVKRTIEQLAMEMNRIGEGRSEWHREREISGYIGSRKTINQSPAEY